MFRCSLRVAVSILLGSRPSGKKTSHVEARFSDVHQFKSFLVCVLGTFGILFVAICCEAEYFDETRPLEAMSIS